MDLIDSPRQGRLRGRALLLSASVPAIERAEIYRRIEAAEAIEEAVVSLARAVLSEGGTLVCGGHPTISPLLALVVREYVTPRLAERPAGSEDDVRAGPQVEIYQSEVYRERIAEATQRLQRQPGVSVHWVAAAPGEFVDPEVRDRPQAPDSLRRMRLAMVQRSDLAAMVCIGGMEGVEDEARLFHECCRRLPVYVLESTGGAAAELARHAPDEDWLRVPERGVRETVEAFWRGLGPGEGQGGAGESRRAGDNEGEREQSFAFPYAYLAQKIVAEVIRADPSRQRRRD